MKQPAIARLESGDHNPTIETLWRLAVGSGSSFTSTSRLVMPSEGAQSGRAGESVSSRALYDGPDDAGRAGLWSGPAPAQRTYPDGLDGFCNLAKVRVAGSSPVVRSSESAGQPGCAPRLFCFLGARIARVHRADGCDQPPRARRARQRWPDPGPPWRAGSAAPLAGWRDLPGASARPRWRHSPPPT